MKIPQTIDDLNAAELRLLVRRVALVSREDVLFAAWQHASAIASERANAAVKASEQCCSVSDAMRDAAPSVVMSRIAKYERASAELDAAQRAWDRAIRRQHILWTELGKLRGQPETNETEDDVLDDGDLVAEE